MFEVIDSERPVKLGALDFSAARMQVFVEEYLKDFHQTHAAIRAGYPPESAQQCAHHLMKQHAVASAVARARAAMHPRTGVTPENVLRKLGAMLGGDIRAVLNPDGTLRNPHEMAAVDAAMVAGIKTRRSIELDENGKPQVVEIQEVKMHDQGNLLSLAMRHLGMLNDKLDVNVTSLADRMRHAMARGGAVDVEAEPDNRITAIMENQSEYPSSAGQVLIEGQAQHEHDDLIMPVIEHGSDAALLASLLGDAAPARALEEGVPLASNHSAPQATPGFAGRPPRPTGPGAAQTHHTHQHDSENSFQDEEIDLDYLLS